MADYVCLRNLGFGLKTRLQCRSFYRNLSLSSHNKICRHVRLAKRFARENHPFPSTANCMNAHKQAGTDGRLPSPFKTKTDPSTILVTVGLPVLFSFFGERHAHIHGRHTHVWECRRGDWGLSAQQGDAAICPSKGLIQPSAQATESSIFLLSNFCLLAWLWFFLFVCLFMREGEKNP